MKYLILLSLVLALLVACSPEAPSEDVIESGNPAAADIQIVVAADDFATGTPRIPFVLYAGVDQVADVQSIDLTAFDLNEESPPAVWEGSAVNYSDYEVPYWVGFPELPNAGPWGLAAEITLADGSTTQAQFAIQVEEANQSPSIGSQAPASENRTLKDVASISELTSGRVPVTDLYEMTVAEAIQTGRPTVVSLATPAFCQTKICAPVVRSVETVFNELGDQVNFIHLEIYKEFDPLVVADEVEEWGLTSEPWTFVLDNEGMVVARLGGPVSPTELTEALAPLRP